MTDIQTLKKQVEESCGNKTNIARFDQTSDGFLVVVRDAGLVDEVLLQKDPSISKVQIQGNKIRLSVPMIQEEEKKMAKNKYEDLATGILPLVGGRDNITNLTHCVTRLRFNVKDKEAVDVKAIEKLPGALGCQWSGEQLQVIIGQSVADAYDLVCKKAGIAKQAAIDENLDGGKQKLSFGMLIDTIAGCLTPLIPVLLGGGMLKVIILVGEQLGLLTPDMPTWVTLTFVADAAFYFLPIFAGATAANKFHGNMAMGMLIGAMMIHPTFVGMAAEGSGGSVFGIPIYAGSYTSQIFPTILAVAVLVRVQKIVGRFSPDIVRSITEPLFTLIIMIPLTLCVLAPAGAMIGSFLGTAIAWMYDTLGFVAVMLLSAVFAYVVMAGMHVGFTPILINNFAVLGYDPIICVANFISNFNQGAACAAVALKSKDKNVRSTALSCAITAIFGGVTEPAMFGVTIRYKTPMYGCMLGGLAGGLVAGLSKCALYAFPGNGGFFGLPVFVGPTASNLIMMGVALAVGMLVTFVGTMFFYKETVTEEETAVQTVAASEAA